MLFFLCLFFFFKQKTAYEMRISDWSSDVCSSDLDAALQLLGAVGNILQLPATHRRLGGGAVIASLGERILGRTTLEDVANADGTRSEERRVGKECVSTCRSRWSP